MKLYRTENGSRWYRQRGGEWEMLGDDGWTKLGGTTKLVMVRGQRCLERVDHRRWLVKVREVGKL